MNVEIKVDKNIKSRNIVIYTEKIDEEILNVVEELSNINNKILKAFKDEKMYILNQNEIEKIYTENGKVFVRCNNEIYIIKNRLYELEKILNPKIFSRISNSEIVNFNMVKNIDFKIIGTLILNFKDGNKSYVSRRYIPKIKKFLDV